MLSGLLAPLRLPERVMESLESLVEAARELGPMRSELTRVREQTEPLPSLMPAIERVIKQIKPVPEVARTVRQISRQAEPLAELLPALSSLEEALTTRLDSLQAVAAALEGRDSHLNLSVRKLGEEVAEMHKTIGGLQGDVERLTDRLPEPEEKRGPLEAAREVLTGSGD